MTSPYDQLSDDDFEALITSAPATPSTVADAPVAPEMSDDEFEAMITAPMPQSAPVSGPAMAELVSPTGERVSLPESDRYTALAQGYTSAADADAKANEAALQAEYGGAGSQALALGEGFGRGATLGATDVVGPALAGVAGSLAGPDVERAVGPGLGAPLDTRSPFEAAYQDARDEIKARKEANPTTALVGELAGAVAPTLLSGGTGALAGAARMSPAALANTAGIAAGTKAAGLATGTVGKAALAGLAGGAVEGGISAGLLGASDVAEEKYIADPGLAAEHVLTQAGAGVFLGGGFGGALGLGAGLLAKGASKLDDVAEGMAAKSKPADVATPAVADDLDTITVNLEAKPAVTTPEELAARDARTTYVKQLEQFQAAEGGFDDGVQAGTRAIRSDVDDILESANRVDEFAGVATKNHANRVAGSEFVEVPSGVFDEVDAAGPNRAIPNNTAKEDAALRDAADALAKAEAARDAAMKAPSQAPAYKVRASDLDDVARDNDAFLREFADDPSASGYARFDIVDVPVSAIDVPPPRDPGRTASIERGMADGVEMPPVKAVLTGGKLDVEDGIHRVNAAKAAGKDTIPVRVERWVPRNGEAEALPSFQAGKSSKAPTGAAREAERRVAAAQKELGKATIARQKAEAASPSVSNAPKVRVELSQRHVNARAKLKAMRDELESYRSGLTDVESQGVGKAIKYFDQKTAMVEEAFRKGDVGDAFVQMDDLKRGLGRMRANMPAQSQDVIERIYPVIQKHLEDVDQYGAMAEVQRRINPGWSDRISNSKDASWKSFTSVSGKRSANEWDNLYLSSPEAIKGLLSNVGDAGSSRAEEVFRKNLRSIARDALERAKALGGKELQAEAETIVTKVRAVEDRLDAVARLRADSIAGQRAMQASSTADLAASAIGMVSPRAAFAISGTAMAKRKVLAAVAESGNAVATKVVKNAAKLVRVANSGVRTLGRVVPKAAAVGLAAAAEVAPQLVSQRKIDNSVQNAQALMDPRSPEARQLFEHAAAVEQDGEPELAQSLVDLELRRAQLITSMLPRQMQGIFAPKARLDPMSERKLKRTVSAAYDPEKTIGRLSDGVATREEIAAMKALFPGMYGQFVSAVEQELTRSRKVPSREQQQVIHAMTGLVVRPSLEPQAIVQQQAVASASNEPAQPQGGGKAPSVNPDTMLTRADRLAGGG